MRLPLLALLVPALLVRAHGPDPSDVSLYRRNNLLERAAIQKRCGATLYGIHKRRLARRGAQGPARRQEPGPAALCSMTPELTEGPYHVNNELYRQNVTDGEPGVPLTLHVTFMDVATCEVAPNLWMEIWAANTTGFYSGFTAASLAAGQGGGSGGGGGGPPPDGSMSGGPPGGTQGGAPPTGTGTGSSSGAAATTSLSPLSGADSPTDDGSPVRGNNATDQLTFLRGVTQANELGEATMYTIVPGWYTGRAVHIHIRVFNGSSVADNGTFISSSGTAHHTGQLFFKQTLLDDIAKLPPYTLNPVAYENSTTNEQDGIYPYAGIGGYDPDLETEQLGDDLADGLEGHIVITINGSVRLFFLFPDRPLFSQFYSAPRLALPLSLRLSLSHRAPSLSHLSLRLSLSLTPLCVFLTLAFAFSLALRLSHARSPSIPPLSVFPLALRLSHPALRVSHSLLLSPSLFLSLSPRALLPSHVPPLPALVEEYLIKAAEPMTREKAYARLVHTLIRQAGLAPRCAAPGCNACALLNGDRAKLQTCSRCRVTRYCSKACQARAWRDDQPPHKAVCAVLCKFDAHQYVQAPLGGFDEQYARILPQLSDDEVEVFNKWLTARRDEFGTLSGLLVGPVDVRGVDSLGIKSLT